MGKVYSLNTFKRLKESYPQDIQYCILNSIISTQEALDNHNDQYRVTLDLEEISSALMDITETKESM